LPETVKQTSTHYIAVLLRQAQYLDLDIDAILQSTKIPPEKAYTETEWIDIDYFTALVKEMWELTQNETFGLDPISIKRGTWAVACEFMMSADTLGGLYRKGERILSFLAPGSASYKLEENSGSVLVLPQVHTGESDPEHFLMEFMCVLLHRFPSWSADVQIPLQKAFFSYPEPPHSDFYQELFHCDIAFDQPQSGFSFSSNYLNKPITRTETELRGWLKGSPADLLYLPGRESSMQSLLKAALKKGLKEKMRFPAFDAICSDLCMSGQVVRRRLNDEGTSYQQIKDAIRSDRAHTLLMNPEVSIAHVAEKVGFSEAAAFSRAFKKWTGSSPADFRNKQRTTP
jgi:AraC-like DNA-binding protein